MADPTTSESLADTPTHKPYVPDNVTMPESTVSAVVLGSVLGIVFAASSLYLVLKVGMTVSASIPVAVLAITLFRALSRGFGFRQATILENNIVQTAGSAGESIAFGVGVTMPALLLLGFQMDLPRVMVVSILGGSLGILAMIPLRRAFIVKMHGRPGQPGTLLYPEGTAAAQVLISGEKGGTTGKTVFIGFGIAFLHKILTEGMVLLVGTLRLPLTFINKSAVFANEYASELLGVGYIIGLRTSAIMMAGAVLGYLVIIPLIAFIGANSLLPIAPGEKPISEMSTSEIRNSYLLFIGAGTVATAGIISMFRTLPMIARSIRAGLKSVKGSGGTPVSTLRTENDMSMRVVIFGSLALIAVLALFLMTEVGILAALAGGLLVVVFGFLFVTVSARLTGEIGSSSNPISGMTVATLTLTCLIFLALGWTDTPSRVLALSIAAVVCVASSNGGTTAQSLKTGFLVGGTPKAMQYAILIGSFTSALVIGGTLLALNATYTVYSSKPENLPGVTFTSQEMALLKDKETYQGKEYLVFDKRRETFGANPRDEIAKAREGYYLIDPSTGRPAFLRDPSIMGRLSEDDDGKTVKRGWDAPKTQVMGIIINGVLKRQLSWTLVLIGALIAIMLELCGVSALAFAVGVYVPIQYSAPIFLGGIIRWFVDKRLAQTTGPEPQTPEEKAAAEIEAIRKSETSPGVLLAAGYIAGGSLAGVLLAFTNFSETLPGLLATWQYRTTTLSKPTPVSELPEVIPGLKKEGLEEFLDLNKEELARWAPVPRETKILLPKKGVFQADRDMHLGDVAKEKLGSESKALKLLDLNKQELVPYVKVEKGTTIRMADYKTRHIEQDTTLGELAEKEYGSRDKALVLFDRNSEALPDLLENKGRKPLELPASSPDGIARLEEAKELPAGTVLNLPQKNWPALMLFGLLAVILAAAGIGMIFKSPEEEPNSDDPDRPAELRKE
jgi:putative OPT family oligopeptide transporter